MKHKTVLTHTFRYGLDLLQVVLWTSGKTLGDGNELLFSDAISEVFRKAEKVAATESDLEKVLTELAGYVPNDLKPLKMEASFITPFYTVRAEYSDTAADLPMSTRWMGNNAKPAPVVSIAGPTSVSFTKDKERIRELENRVKELEAALDRAAEEARANSGVAKVDGYKPGPKIFCQGDW